MQSRVERAPRASSFELKELQRRLHEEQIEAPRDLRLHQLEIELRRLRAQADRNADCPSAAVLPRTSPLAAHAPIQKPRIWGRTHRGGDTCPTVLRPAAVALQRTVAAIERGLEVGDTMTAARLLERAQVDLATLRRSSTTLLRRIQI